MNIPKITGFVIIIAGIVLGLTTLNHAIYTAPQEAALVPETTQESNVSIPTQTTTTATASVTSTTSIDSSLPGKPTVATSTPKPSSSTLPSRLIIPSLNIDANVQQVGINVKGNMGTPNNFTDVAWYKPGTIPGEKGSAVMDGHVDNGLALAGVFKKLNTIKVGDDVYVTRADGVKLHFRVVDTQLVPYTDKSANEKVFTQNDAARLNLITCTGEWVPGDKTYDHRLVVYTKLVK